MNIEHFILPILTLIIAVCSIFVAPKNMEIREAKEFERDEV